MVFGRNTSWKVAELSVKSELLSLAWFESALYACSNREIFKWDGAEFQPLTINGDRPKTLQYLNSGVGGLCAIGTKDLFRFDGATWSRVD